MDVSKYPSLQEVTDERKKVTMEAARLEGEILQTITRHAQENHLPYEVIALALVNCAGYFQKRIINRQITHMLYQELNGVNPASGRPYRTDVTYDAEAQDR